MGGEGARVSRQLQTAIRMICLLLVCVLLLSGCDQTGSDPPPAGGQGSRDATAKVLLPEASGALVLGNSVVTIDASHRADGYVMVRYDGSNSKVRLQVLTPDDRTYTYVLDSGGEYETFPLADGNGSYALHLYENIEGTTYAQAFADSIQVTLDNEFSPFLYPNQYVDFNADSQAVAFGEKLAQGADNDFDVLKNVYQWITDNISYDYELADSVGTGYLPNCDKVLESEKGICFDYAALACTILRSQRIPSRLVIGYAGEQYHAWISVFIEGEGWINNAIEFHGTDWVRMDPTADAAAAPLEKYIGDGTTYNEMYLY